MTAENPFLKLNFRLAACLFLALLLGFMPGKAPASADPPLDPSAEAAVIRLEGTTLTFAGQVSDRNVDRFFEAVDGKDISTLVIASGGGEVNAGMAMGEWVFANRVDVVVEHMCMSSCANYVFTAGRRKTINRDSIVGWHGNVRREIEQADDSVRTATLEAYELLPEEQKDKMDLSTMIEQTVRETREYLERSLERQTRFFDIIGVDEYLCRIGNEEYGAEDFFLLSVQDMMRFGITDVTAPEDYESTDLAPFRKTGRSVRFIRLD